MEVTQKWDLYPAVQPSAHTLLTPAHLYHSGILQSALLIGKTDRTPAIKEKVIKPTAKVMMASCSEREKE